MCFSLPEYDLLMLCNARDDRVTFPGGKRTIGEEVLKTGLRETLEEAGLDVEKYSREVKFGS